MIRHQRNYGVRSSVFFLARSISVFVLKPNGLGVTSRAVSDNEIGSLLYGTVPNHKLVDHLGDVGNVRAPIVWIIT
jgi:hypothetical protein